MMPGKQHLHREPVAVSDPSNQDFVEVAAVADNDCSREVSLGEPGFGSNQRQCNLNPLICKHK